jgi:hypothetical protein
VALSQAESWAAARPQVARFDASTMVGRSSAWVRVRGGCVRMFFELAHTEFRQI